MEPVIEDLPEWRIQEIQEEDLVLTRESGDTKISIEILEIDDDVSTSIIPEQDNDHLYFSYNVKMTNNTSREIRLEPGWMVFTIDNHVYRTDEGTAYLRKPSLEGKIAQGESKEGPITFKTKPRFLFLESGPRNFYGDLRPLFIPKDAD
ncbi:MAG: hypothetical protein LBI67_03725 [Treponema sp.]|nr:hypothetical protein [Treponema sp.]